MPAWQAGCEEEDAGDTLSCSPQQAGRQGGDGSAVVRGQGPAATPPVPPAWSDWSKWGSVGQQQDPPPGFSVPLAPMPLDQGFPSSSISLWTPQLVFTQVPERDILSNSYIWGL